MQNPVRVTDLWISRVGKAQHNRVTRNAPGVLNRALVANLSACRNTVFFKLSYVCPEPVLVKWSLLALMNRASKGVFPTVGGGNCVGGQQRRRVDPGCSREAKLLC